MSGIYKITNSLNGRFYIGSTKCFKLRFYAHKWNLQKGKHTNPKLQSAWNKYGEGAFSFSVLLECAQDQLIPKEQEYIDNLKPFYNICSIAGRGRTANHTEEAKIRMKIAQKKASLTRASWNKGKTGIYSEETLKKISEAAKRQKKKTGHKLTEEHKANISLAKKGKPSPRKGIQFSAEHKLALSAAKIGKKRPPRSAEHCAKISEIKKQYWAKYHGSKI